MAMTVLVTGSGGRIGRVIVNQLLERGDTVRGFDAAEGSGDLCDAAAVRSAVAGVDAVIHAGAIAHNIVGEEAKVLAVGLRGTHHVLEACHLEGVRRVVCFSSVQALGIFAGTRLLTSLPLTDDYPSCPQNAYQLAKHLGEKLCETYHTLHGVETVSLRPVYVSRPEEYPFWRTCTTEQGPRAVGDYGAYVDVRDVASAAVLALTAPLSGPECLLLTAADTDSPLPTAELISRYYPELPWALDQESYLADNPYRSLVHCQRAATVLDWRPQHSWREVQHA